MQQLLKQSKNKHKCALKSKFPISETSAWEKFAPVKWLDNREEGLCRGQVEGDGINVSQIQLHSAGEKAPKEEQLPFTKGKQTCVINIRKH